MSSEPIKQKIVDEVKDLYKIIKLRVLRRTPGVYFDALDRDLVPQIDAIDRVIHEHDAYSPGPVGEVTRPWYMHPYQDDNLIVLTGIRFVDIYTPEHGEVEHFTVTPHSIKKNGKLIFEGAAMLVWPKNVFHRIHSDPKVGSSSINLARHYPGIDIRHNFNIFDLDTKTGKFQVIREGFLDQPNIS